MEGKGTNFNRKISLKLTVALMLLTVAISTVSAVALITINRSASWSITTDLGLELYQDSECTTVMSAIDWGEFARNSGSTVTAYLRNEGNEPQTWFWTVANLPTGFTIEISSSVDGVLAPETTSATAIAKDGVVVLTMTLTSGDVEAGTYGCDLTFNLGSFLEVNEPIVFGTTEVIYELDCSDYLSVTSNSFDKAEYQLGETLNWEYTVQNIHAEYDVDSFSYQVNLYDGTNYVEEWFIGQKDCVPNLEPSDTVTVQHTFTAPSTEPATEYHLKLRLTGHNSEGEFTYVTNVVNPDYQNGVGTWSIEVTGFDISSTANIRYAPHGFSATPVTAYDITMEIYDLSDNSYVSTIQDITFDVVAEYGVAIGAGETFAPVSWIPFSTPNLYGNYEIVITVGNWQYESAQTYAYTTEWEFTNFNGNPPEPEHYINRDIEVTGMTEPSQSSTVHFEFYNNYFAQISFQYKIQVWEGETWLFNIQDYTPATIGTASTYTSPTYSFTSPSTEGTNYRIVVVIKES